MRGVQEGAAAASSDVVDVPSRRVWLDEARIVVAITSEY